MNRPPPIQVKHLQNDGIVATASQKLCLFKIFQLIFNDIVVTLPSFIVYKQLREILDLVLSLSFRRKCPPLRQWCIRYEAQHAYFKKITIKSNNFKNVPKMLATRYSLKQIYKLSRLPHLRMSNYAVRIQKIEISAFNKQMKELLLNHFGDINLNKDIVQCSKLCYDNIEYCRFTVHIIGLLNINEQPIFGQIIRILKANEK
ncbi:unnamed protein product [Adineta steineri]|uniref:Uncharacterized protein n=1 Tax=Adineta steineri TaxID=433720 RepID=A0A815U1Y4_9BILA|nr:unnamed protein product [Adineta steineri]CAF1647470.1 unnamed protein product [Adineta steineri]